MQTAVLSVLSALSYPHNDALPLHLVVGALVRETTQARSDENDHHEGGHSSGSVNLNFANVSGVGGYSYVSCLSR